MSSPNLRFTKKLNCVTSSVTHFAGPYKFRQAYERDVNAQSCTKLKLKTTYLSSFKRLSSPHNPLSSSLTINTTKFTTHPTLNHLQKALYSSYKFPDMAAYKNFNNDEAKFKPRAFTYLMVGGLGAVGAVVAKKTVLGFIKTLNPAADTLALAKIEVELKDIAEGTNAIIKWRGKPVFIRHRTPSEIEEAKRVDIKKLRHPEQDEERTKRPEWLIMIGICTHLGCVPVGESGDYGGWYCPCHGSHYDISGRIRQGPAPLNLEVPEYNFDETGQVVTIG